MAVIRLIFTFTTRIDDFKLYIVSFIAVNTSMALMIIYTGYRFLKMSQFFIENLMPNDKILSKIFLLFYAFTVIEFLLDLYMDAFADFEIR